jgi:hypothetical protein
MMMKKYYVFILLLFSSFIIFFSSVCETTPVGQAPLPDEPIAHPPKMVVGDTWVATNWNREYGIDTFIFKVTHVESDGSFTLEVTSKKDGITRITNYDNALQRINPPQEQKLLNFPLFIGKKWSEKTYARSVRGDYKHFENEYTVKDYETVSTEAGSFQAFKIVKSQNVSETGKKFIEEYWYSPEVKTIVKSKPTWKIGKELISYSVIPPGKLTTTVETKKAQPSAIAPSMQREGISQYWAVIVGISDYRDTRIPSLRYAAADARSFYTWLTSPEGGRHPPSRIKLLVNEQATGSSIKEALFVWLKQALEEDIVIIYFAGHGSPESPDFPDNLFILPYDAQYENIAITGFPMWDIETALSRFIKAKKAIVIADACHAGGVGQSFDIARRANRGLKVNTISTGLQMLSKVGDGICIISASDDNQFSQEGKQWGDGHGVFTYFLLRGLTGEADYNNDSRVSLGELIPYLSEQVRRETRNAQCPTVAGKFDPVLSIGR